MNQVQPAKVNIVKSVLWVMAVIFVTVGLSRFLTGLGASTNMTDALPWGAWKIFNMVGGAALATSGFVVACVIYVFQLEKYRPLARLAILVGFLGYGSSLTALIFDIGLPHRGWHPFFFVFWNPHSFLFEVFWCVSIYWGVTAFEMVPIITERLPFPKFTHFLHEIALPIVILGITLSTMHHSSLGSLFMVSPTRLYPLWFSTWIPVEFFVSAMGSGMATIVVITIIYGWLYEKELNIPVLSGMAKGSMGMLALYLGIKVVDFTLHGKWHFVFGPDITWESFVFYAEILLQVLIPVGIFAIPSLRKKVEWLFIGGVSAFLGLVLHRLDVGIIGYFRTAGEVYIPNISELGVSIGVLCAASLVFLFVVERFHIFDAPEHCEVPDEEGHGAHPDMAKQWTLDEVKEILMGPQVARVTLIIVAVIPLSFFLFRNQAMGPFEPTSQPVQAPLGIDEARDMLLIDGNRTGESVEFPHRLHQEFMGGSESCESCHHLSLPNDTSSQCWRCHSEMHQAVDMFDHDFHQEANGGRDYCFNCHEEGRAKSSETASQCIRCHNETGARPMGGISEIEDGVIRMVPSYYDAMHDRCLTCHRLAAVLQGESESPQLADSLGNCQACHPIQLLPATASAD